MTVPRATYRLQLHAGFGFRQAGEVADYLADLGVSHLYSSPQLQAAPSSEHGYDVVDPMRLSDELGGPPAHAGMLAALRGAGLGMVLDIVPNHMVISTPLNRWWWDTLRFGRASPWSKYFDIDWDAPHAEGRLLLPVLGDRPEAVLQRKELSLSRRGPELRLCYFDHEFPLGPGATAGVLRDAGAAFGHAAEQAEALAEVSSVEPPDRDSADLALDALLADPDHAAALDAALQRAAAPDRLAGLLDRQPYRLTFWRDDAGGRNYRRFFDVDSLAAVCVEDEEVFDAVHAIPIAAALTGAADGLRIDHPDGLRDPVGYLQRLRMRLPEAWLVIEKILEPGETARDAWPVDGLTGYAFLNAAQAVLVDPAGAEPLADAWRRFTGNAPAWPDLVRQGKLLALQSMFAVELDRLVRLLMRSPGGPETPGRDEVRSAIEELICHFHIYRTYIRPPSPPVAADVRRIGEACDAARRGRPDLAGAIDLIAATMLSAAPGPDAAEFTLRFQQLSGAVMAKGVEDTAFYRHLRLVALNEVGGDPGSFGISLDAFHQRMAARREDWPHSMLSTSTHDTKRSEDVRARLLALSEIPGEWAAAALRWRDAAAPLRAAAPIDPHDEYLLYQTMVGAWPIDRGRTAAFVLKAARESKLRTSWTDPDEAYEAAIAAFIERLYRDDALMAQIQAMADRITPAGRSNSLSQTLLKLTCPGVPDIYQGCELWDLSLVDPDNRRPVDFDLRRRMLFELEQLAPADIWQRRDEGLPKLWTIRQALALRARRPEALDGAADYAPIIARGEQADRKSVV